MILTRTSRQKRLSRIRRKKREILKFLEEAKGEAKEQGFSTAEEYLLWRALRREGIEADHNVNIYGVEVDLYISRAKLIVEVGYPDENFRIKWDMLKEMGYKFLYFSNREVWDRSLLPNTVGRIKGIYLAVT